VATAVKRNLLVLGGECEVSYSGCRAELYDTAADQWTELELNYASCGNINLGYNVLRGFSCSFLFRRFCVR
jgi:hypothetical protein